MGCPFRQQHLLKVYMEQKKDVLTFAPLTLPLAAEIRFTPVVAHRDTFADVRLGIFRPQGLTKNQWLSRNPPGFQHQSGHAWAPGLVIWETTSCCLSGVRWCGTPLTALSAEAPSLKDRANQSAMLLRELYLSSRLQGPALASLSDGLYL